MPIHDALLEASKKIPRLDAEVLLAFVLKESKEYLLTHSEKELPDSQTAKFEQLVAERKKGKPVAYLTNSKEFFGLDFFVDENVLIPRPETELLVEEILRIKPASILDVGTGSGCIAVAVKKNLPKCKVLACDISPAALEVTKRNASKHQIEIKFFQSDLLKSFDNNVELIVANLPYVPSDSAEVQASVKEHEPSSALFAGNDGLDTIRRLMQQIAKLSDKPKFVLLEIGAGQVPELEKFVKETLPQSQLEFIKDLAGIERVAKIEISDQLSVASDQRTK